jgi:Reverse transcriptase (RNA-dependent DNA polymerase)
VTARTKDGTVRVCTNLTAANKAIVVDKYPLPTMEEMTSQINGAIMFTKLDLLWGYTQLELDRSARYLTSFVSHVGVYQWKSVPFGISSVPSAFQKVIRKMLENLPGCTSILDDILCWGSSIEEHDTRLRSFLSRLADHGATLRVDKCKIGHPQVEFNGHLISAVGIRPLHSNVEGIVRMPVPIISVN